MTDDEHGLFYKVIKMKPLIYWGTKYEDAFYFMIYCPESLHKMGVVKRYGVEFVSF